MEKKVVIGISAYAGSNLPRIFAVLDFLINFYYGHKTRYYSLEKCTIDCITDTINQSKQKNIIYIIHDISSVEQIDTLISTFEEQTFRPIGIEVPWEQCFEHLKSEGIIDKSISEQDWRKINVADPYRESILKCHQKIGTRNDYVYLCQTGCTLQEIGRLADDIMLLK